MFLILGVGLFFSVYTEHTILTMGNLLGQVRRLLLQTFCHCFLPAGWHRKVVGGGRRIPRVMWQILRAQKPSHKSKLSTRWQRWQRRLWQSRVSSCVACCKLLSASFRRLSVSVSPVAACPEASGSGNCHARRPRNIAKNMSLMS